MLLHVCVEISPSLNMGINIYLGSLWHLMLVFFNGLKGGNVITHPRDLCLQGMFFQFRFIISVELINFVGHRSIVFIREKQAMPISEKHTSLENVRNVL